MGVVLLAITAIAIAIVLSISARRVMAARAETQRVRGMFGRYVAPHVVDEILARKDARIFSGRSGYATILVCRIWNFARFAEQLAPDETLRYLNEFYTIAGRSIHKHRGMIDTFLGDGIVGAFGVPLEDPLQEEHALRAAIDIIRLVDAMNARWTAEGRKPLRCGIGIHSGTVIAGDTGFAQRREFAVVGVEAIVANRLQEYTEPRHAYILASEATLKEVTDLFITLPLETIALRGMQRNVRAAVIRGVARSDNDRLLMPRPDDFKTTTIEAPAPAPLVEEPREDPPPPEPTRIAYPTTKIPPPASAAPTTTRDNGFSIPETARARFGIVDDQEPAFPEPIEPPSHYEDDSGRPPLRLPP